MILDNNRAYQMQAVAPEHTKASGEHFERMAALGATAAVPERKSVQVHIAMQGRVQDTPEYFARMTALADGLAVPATPATPATPARLAGLPASAGDPAYLARMLSLNEGAAAPAAPAAAPAPAGAAAAEAAIAKAIAAATAEAAKAPAETTEAPAESTEADRPAGSDLSQEFLQSAADRVYDAWDAAGEIDPGLVAELATESGRSEQQVRAVAESLVAWRAKMREIGVI